MTQKIVGLLGKRYSGKTTVANYLSSKGFTKLHAFAPGKAMCKAYYIYCGASEDEAERMVNGDLRDVPSPCLDGETSRWFMEELGYWMGVQLGPKWTLGRVLNVVDFEYGALESVVYETVMLVGRPNTLLINLERPGNEGLVGSRTDTHSLDAVLDTNIITVVNDGSLEELYTKINSLVEKYLG